MVELLDVKDELFSGNALMHRFSVHHDELL